MLKKSGFSRFMTHLLAMPWQFKRHFSQQALINIEKATAASERSHNGEIRVVVEGSLSPMNILQGVTPRHRAIELFSQLRVWDTAANNGVLIYLLLADRDVEIIADRGIHQQVGEAGWEAICREMEAMFRQGLFETGVLHGITRIGAALQQYFPPTPDDQNELPNAPLEL